MQIYAIIIVEKIVENYGKQYNHVRQKFNFKMKEEGRA